MSLRKIATAGVMALTLAGTMAATVQPADAWCRFGRCGYGPGWRGGYGWRGGWGPGAVAAGVLAGAVVGTAAAAAAAGPGPYYGRPGGYYACPPGYHWGPGGRACYAN